MNPLTFYVYGNATQYNQTMQNAMNISNQITNRMYQNHKLINQFGNHYAQYGDRFTFNLGTPKESKSQFGWLLARYAGVYAIVRMIENGISSIANLTTEWISHTIKVAAEYERMKIAFEVLTGDPLKGNKLLDDLTQLAIRTPFVTKDLTGAAQMLMGMGVSFESVLPAVERLGDIAGGDAEKLRRLALAFGQVVSAGRFMGTELRQFTEAGVGANDFAKVMGISTKEFRNRMHDGEIGVSDMINGINALTNRGGRFYDMNARQNRTVLGQWNALKETIDLVLRKTGLELFEKYNIAGKLSSATSWMSENFGRYMNDVVRMFEPLGTELWNALKDVFGTDQSKQMAKNFVDLFIQGFHTVVMGVRTVVPILITTFNLLTPVFKGLLLLVNTVYLAINGLVMLVGGVTKLLGFKETGKNINDYAFKNIEKGMENVGRIFEGTKFTPALPKMEDYKTRGGLFNLPKEWTAYAPPHLREEVSRAFREGLVLGQTKVIDGKWMKRTEEGWVSDASGAMLIPIIRDFAPKVQEEAQKILEYIKKGVSPLEEFQNTIDKINKASYPILNKDGFKEKGPLLDMKQWGIGAVREFKELEKKLGLKEPSLPKAYYFGTSEAQDRINEAQYQDKQLDVQERIEKVLEAAKELDQQQKDLQVRMAEALEKLVRKPTPVARGS